MDDQEDSRIRPRDVPKNQGERPSVVPSQTSRVTPSTVRGNVLPAALDAQAVLNEAMNGQAQGLTPAALSNALDSVPESDRVVLMLQMIDQFGGQGAAMTVAAADSKVKLIEVIVDKLGPLRRQAALDELQIRKVDDELDVLGATAPDRRALAAVQAKWTLEKSEIEGATAKRRLEAEAKNAYAQVELDGARTDVRNKVERERIAAEEQVIPTLSAAAQTRAQTAARRQLRQAGTESVRENAGHVVKFYVLPVLLLAIVIAVVAILVIG